MQEERRLVWRVQRHWREIAGGRRFPRRDEIEPWMRGEDGANCLLMVVESPVELSHFVVVGVDLAVALCPTDTLAGLLLSRVPRVVSERCGLIFQGAATLRGVDILYRSVLLPLSEDGVVIDHVLGRGQLLLSTRGGSTDATGYVPAALVLGSGSGRQLWTAHYARLARSPSPN